jgi:hypothetical protein
LSGLVSCVDFGSTFTKAALVDVDEGRLLATASHRTTLDTDVLDGWEACRDRLVCQHPLAADAQVLACSSAGGGLRIGVVGNEELVTAEAGRRVALSSGGRVVHVAAASGRDSGVGGGSPAAPTGVGGAAGTREGGLGGASVEALRAAAPDVVLLVGGTDHGNAEVLLGCARTLARAAWAGPVVVAGNVAAQEEVAAILSDAQVPHVLADNVVPRIGVLAPDSARAAIREMFLAHVIGGKHLSARADFTAMVRGATPDVVLTAVELLASELAGSAGPVGSGARVGSGDPADSSGSVDRPDPAAPATAGAPAAAAPANPGDVVVVDIGGATTDVHSAVVVDPEDAGLARQVVAPMPVSRTVEGDLGMRWGAVDTVAAGREAGLVGEEEYDELAEAARVRRADPSYLPASDRERAHDERLAAVAAGVALRRHAGRQQVRFGPDGRLVERTGKDLREVGLLVGSGGVLWHHPEPFARRVLAGCCGHDIEGGWLLPRAPRTAVDRDYVLAAAGLLAGEHPHAARALLRRLLEGGQR